MTILDSLSETEILGLTIIGEARGESIAGQVAVGCVIRNRLRANHKNYHEVCLSPRQFSCWNENDPNRVVLMELAGRLVSGDKITDPYLKQCIYIASGIQSWDIMDNTAGATNYMTRDLFDSNTVSWTKNATNMSIEGHHIFFNV